MATNPYVNKVVYGNQTVMDISDTTAEEANVSSGEVFYKASGARSVGTADYYSPSDTAETTIDDADYFPYYDTSATAKRKSLWSNIKSVLKTYFVSLFVIEKTKVQYDALPSAEKNDPDKVYYVPDYEDTSKTWVRLDDSTTANDKVWSSSKISSELGGVAQIDDTTTSQTKAWSSTKISTEIDGKLSYSVNDDTATDIADADFVPYYDYSAAARKKSTWANIIAKIKAKLATVATTGSYNDLSNKPSIPAAQIQSDWNQTTTTALDYIKNKPTIPAAQVNSDWNSSSGVSEILNKPTLGTASTKDVPSSGNASSTEVVLGSDTRLTDSRTPTSHTHTTSDITNFPTLATVATSGSYSDLIDEPQVESAVSGGLTPSLVTTGDKYKWNNGLLRWYTGSALTGATSVSIPIDYDANKLVIMLADDNDTGKPVKYTSVEFNYSYIIGSEVTIRFPALAYDTTFQVGFLI